MPNFKPYRGAPERTPEENEAYHREQISKGLMLIKAWTEDVTPEEFEEGYDSPKMKMDMSAATDYLQAFNALCINTASYSWVRGVIEFMGDVEAKGFQLMPSVDKRSEFETWIMEYLARKKQDNYQILATLRDNIGVLETYLNSADNARDVQDIHN